MPRSSVDCVLWIRLQSRSDDLIGRRQDWITFTGLGLVLRQVVPETPNFTHARARSYAVVQQSPTDP
jgi:hypothetical protein